ncbi:T9SS type A sorting domain-containing protein [Flavobacterium sp. SUN046]|uniref:T9SS type A sorting domain-containing protein n=1 Tax=Flavobacterium sp. SUN046 TaxID=3002440 RepID=UPI002DBD4513|nr:T9SS type A sorting domain-containing protein [Flavobacterium sp. SUN046]MEC4050285.1 T9SS type A sorting domain-containing protein [Flavobacterium sp. SUN046]
MKKLLLFLVCLIYLNGFSQCFTKINAGYDHSLGLKPNGSLWAWGFGEDGGLGTGTDTNKHSPTQSGTATNWAKFCGGYSNTFAIKTDGTLWGSGYNVYGALGIGSVVANTSVFTQIGTATNWKEVAAGETYGIGLREDYTMWAWGFNQYYDLGDGTTTQRNSPVQIGTTADWKTICATRLQCNFAIKTNGTLWGWGINSGAVLGDSSVSAWSVPTLRDTAMDWDKLALGLGYHVLALKTNKTLWAWGVGDFGQTGHDPTTSYANSEFNQIPGLWNAIAVGGDKFSMGIKTDGTLWAWGKNTVGQLGDGTTNNTYIPLQVGTDTNWVSVSCGNQHTIALKSDGSLWAWGDNYYGQLGNGSTTALTLPTTIPIAGCTLSAEEFTLTDEVLKLFPNPAQEELSLNYTGTALINTVVIYDLSGREVYNSHPVVSNNLKASFGIGMLQSGSYILSLKYNEHTVVSKQFLKE